jgi:hypothetical protein
MGLLQWISLHRQEKARKTCIKLYNHAKRMRPGKPERDYLKIVLITKPPFDYQYDEVIELLLDYYPDIEQLARFMSTAAPWGNAHAKGLWEQRTQYVSIDSIKRRLEEQNQAYFREFWGP